MIKVDNLRVWGSVLCLTAVSCTVLADDLNAQRQRYLQLKQAWDSHQMSTVDQLMPTLRDYPLYPDLEFRALTQDIRQTSLVSVKNFINQYPTLPLSDTLASRYINELARREDWRGIVSLTSKAPHSEGAQCNYYYAQYMTGNKGDAYLGAEELWMQGDSLPSSCDKLFNAWKSTGQLSAEDVLERMREALQQNNPNLVTSLARMLPPSYQSTENAIARLQSDPHSIENFARNVGPNDFSKEATIKAFARLARKNSNQARELLPELASLQRMDSNQKQKLEDALAWSLMGNNVSYDDSRWRDDVIKRSKDGELIERRIRMALATGNNGETRTWLDILPSDVRDKDEWRYWRASLLIDEGKKDEGEAILRQMVKLRGFYPMVAAQKLGIDYNIHPDVAEAPSGFDNAPTIARIRELMYWGNDNTARREWINLVKSRSRPQQATLARYAFEQNWALLSIQATITGKLWNHLKERFPMPWVQEFKNAASGKDIQASYAMAIARQESAFNSQARSPVGASGLMQLMPATASEIAQRSGISYGGSSQLFDPRTNIQLGSSYLDYVYKKFNENRILASAAYNAGPGRVNTWLSDSSGRIDPVAFIESIPFSETRAYVKNVLTYDVYYRHFMKEKSDILTKSEWSRHY